MPCDEALAIRVKTALERAGRVKEKRMFGGITFMVRGKMCISVGRDRIMCRIDPAIHDTALRRKGCRTVIMRGRPYRGFVHVASNAVKTKAALDSWVKLALEYNRNANTSPGKRRR